MSLRCLVAFATILPAFALQTPPESSHPRTLTFEDRVAAQRAIEQVYWNHRIWPKENPGPKPPLSAVMSDGAIRATVEDYLKKSNALGEYWHRPITAEQLQAEMDRMAKGSRDPALLQDLFTALGNDPAVIAETLARQSLAERLIRNWYASDGRYHGAVRAAAESALAGCSRVECMKSMGGTYTESTWVRSADDAIVNAGSSTSDRAIRLNADEWKRFVEQLSRSVDASPESLSTNTLGPLIESADRFIATAILEVHADQITTATVTWSKTSFEQWWDATRRTLSRGGDTRVDGYTASRVVNTPCSIDTWQPTSGAPDSDGTSVWTGTEMIIWRESDGSRYNPSTDTWTPMAGGGDTPWGKAVWTGTEMIVWGGHTSGGNASPGGRYNPLTDTWSPMSTQDAPVGNYQDYWGTAVWTGTEMIVWGGYSYDGTSFHCYNTGGRYNPATDSWAPTSLGANVPPASCSHTAVWTGHEMIIWGGGIGGRYSPRTDTWFPTSTGANVPSVRGYHTAVWTGTEMIIWGGKSYDHPMNTGGRYNPKTDSWLPTSIGANVPSGAYAHVAVWTGSEMIVWEGGHGGRYNPVSDTWLATAAPSTGYRRYATAVWTGSEMIIWGGYGLHYFNTGWRYKPARDSWVPLSSGNVPDARFRHTAVWTGTEMIVWGGHFYNNGDSFLLNSGGRYRPATDSWSATTIDANDPTPRRYHTAVWTGLEMIVWGGDNYQPLATGKRYNPTTDTWTPISTGANVPTARTEHTAVWTGKEMIVWGGEHYDAILGWTTMNDGGRYNPATDTWTPTSSGVNVPDARSGHSAVWTGTEMIVWGGGTPGASGRYNPSTDNWTPISTAANAPACGVLAVWTGKEMIVSGPGATCAGGRYNPATDSWTSISTAPDLPTFGTAVWTGKEVIIWGGYGSQYDWNMRKAGAKYEPSTNTWLPISIGTNAPAPRSLFTAVWTGTEMIVWGGFNGTYSLHSGARYCADSCTAPQLFYQDADGDGYGSPTSSVYACDLPDGYASNDLDCDDSNAAVHPGAAELCNGIDDNCDGKVDEGGNALCDDGDCCTLDSCDGSSGCQHTANTAPPVFITQPSLGTCPVLWPPNHHYVDFTVADTGATASAQCGIASIQFASCASSQAENAIGMGDGDTLRDCVYEPGAWHVRAERDSTCDPIGRVYETTLVAVDACGNTVTSNPLDVSVWYNQGHAPTSGHVYHPSGNSHDSRRGTNGTYNPVPDACGAGSVCADITKQNKSQSER